MYSLFSSFILAIIFPFLVRTATPPHSPPRSSHPNSPQPMTDFDWDSLDPLEEAKIGSSRFDSLSSTTVHPFSPTWSQDLVDSNRSPTHEQNVENQRHISESRNHQARKQFNSSGRFKMTEEEKREKNRIRSKLYRSQIKQDPKKYSAQKRLSNKRNKAWLNRLPLDEKEKLRQKKLEISKRYYIQHKIAKSKGEKRKKKKERSSNHGQ